MFAYANGNPVMMVDPDGRSATANIVGSIAFGIIVAFLPFAIAVNAAGWGVAILVGLAVTAVMAFFMWLWIYHPNIVQGINDFMEFVTDILGLVSIVLEWIDYVIRGNRNGSNIFPIDGEGQFIFGEEPAESAVLSAQAIAMPMPANANGMNFPVWRDATNVTSVVLAYGPLEYVQRGYLVNTAELRVDMSSDIRARNVRWHDANTHVGVSLEDSPEITVTGHSKGRAALRAEVLGNGGKYIGTGRVTVYSLMLEFSEGVTERFTNITPTTATIFTAPHFSGVPANEEILVLGRWENRMSLVITLGWPMREGFMRSEDINILRGCDFTLALQNLRRGDIRFDYFNAAAENQPPGSIVSHQPSWFSP